MFTKLPWFKGRGDRVATVDEIKKILGEKRFFEGPKLSFPPAYRLKTLKRCAQENKKGADWRMIYIVGMSVQKSLDAHCKKTENEACLFAGTKRWIGEAWSRRDGRSGYRLINFSLACCNFDYKRQRTKLSLMLSEKRDRRRQAPEAMVVEALLTVFKFSGERLLERSAHQGKYARVGYFDRSGIAIMTFPRTRRTDTGIVTYIKPEK